MSLKNILDAPYIPMTLSAYAEDARRRLKEAERYSPTVRQVHQLVWHHAHREQTHYSNDEFYAILALHLLRLVEEPCEYVVRVDCQKPHYEARSWWQTCCLKMGGFL